MSLRDYVDDVTMYYGRRANARELSEIVIPSSNIESSVISSFMATILPGSVFFFPPEFMVYLRNHPLPPNWFTIWSAPLLGFPFCLGGNSFALNSHGQGDHFALIIIDHILREVRVYDSIRGYRVNDARVVNLLRTSFQCQTYTVLWTESLTQIEGSNDCAIFTMRNMLYENSDRLFYDETTRHGFSNFLSDFFFPLVILPPDPPLSDYQFERVSSRTSHPELPLCDYHAPVHAYRNPAPSVKTSTKNRGMSSLLKSKPLNFHAPLPSLRAFSFDLCEKCLGRRDKSESALCCFGGKLIISNDAFPVHSLEFQQLCLDVPDMVDVSRKLNKNVLLKFNPARIPPMPIKRIL